MRLHRFRQTFLGIAFVAGLMAMALSCGGSAESPVGGGGFGSTTADDYGGEPTMAAQAAMPAAAAAPAATSAPASAQMRDSPPLPATPLPSSSASAPAAKSRQDAAETPVVDSSNSAQDQQSGRQLIVEAWITLEVADVDPVARQVETLAAQRGGWVESAEIFGEGGYRSASIRIRVPADNFDKVMASFRALGRVTDEGVASTDVTAQLIDNQARLVAWRSQEERLIHLLEKADNLEHVIDLEKRLAEVRTDIELVDATQRNLENRVAASLIVVNLQLPQRFAADPPSGSLTLAVGEPPVVADAIVARVETLNGYIGQKREYQNEVGQVVEITAFVPSVDLAGLMDFAVTLGEISDRRLDSVGPSPVSEVPDARLSLVIQPNVANVFATGALSLSAPDPIDVAGQIRDQAASLGGYVESWRETRNEEDVNEVIDFDMSVKSKDLRDIMYYSAGLGQVESWEFSSVGQSEEDDAPNAHLQVLVVTGEAYTEPRAVPWAVVGWVIGGLAIVAVVIVAAYVLRRRLQGNRPNDAAGISQRQPLAADAGDDASAGG